jgi:hypothetical protein
MVAVEVFGAVRDRERDAPMAIGQLGALDDLFAEAASLDDRRVPARSAEGRLATRDGASSNLDVHAVTPL